MNPILLIGSGGHCRACIDIVESEARFQISGIVRRKDDLAEPLVRYPTLGTDEDLPDLLSIIPNALITVGQIKSPSIRIRLYELLKGFGAVLPTIVSPIAYISRHAFVDEGTIVMHGSIINACAHIGYNTIINSQALIEHDVLVGPHCHISTGVRINGAVTIEAGCFIGSGVILKEGLRIGHNSIISAGQVVFNNLPPNSRLVVKS